MPLPASLQGRLTLPLIASPMFIVSGPELVIAQCKAGVVGSFPALNARPVSVLRDWIQRIKRELAEYKAAHPQAVVAPFAVNMICHRTNDRLEQDIAICVEEQVPVIITSLQAPSDLIHKVHGYGGVVLHDVTNLRHAEKALGEGVDGLILVCAGAGGHAGTLSPFALLSEVRAIFDGPVGLAGAISSGSGILAAQAMGADFAYMGTRFIATQEAGADPAYKQALIDSRADDIVYSSLFTGVHGNYLRSSIANSGLDPDNLPSADKSTMNFGSGGNQAAKAWRDIWGAGQGVGNIRDVPTTAELVARLKREYSDAWDALQQKRFPQ